MKVISGIKLYDSHEVAELFNISTATLATLRRKGVLRSVQVGRRLYTSEDSIRDYLNGLTAPVPDGRRRRRPADGGTEK